MDEKTPGCLLCSVTFVELNASGEVKRKTCSKSTELRLMRDEFKEIVISVDMNQKKVNLPVREVEIFHRFAKDGKSTLQLPSSDCTLQIQLQNAPPRQLAVFLRILRYKLRRLQSSGFASLRERMRSLRQPSLSDISPLLFNDIPQGVRDRAAAEKALMTPPSSRAPLRRSPRSKSSKGPASKRLKLSDVMCENSTSSKLTSEQTAVLASIKAGNNVFFTGSAGTGKSYLIKHIIGSLAPENTYVTATTGAAACIIGGITLHAFAGISKTGELTEMVSRVNHQSAAVTRWKKCKHLIVDEISMLDAQLMDSLEKIARVIRNDKRPFGGIQLILCGDFLQLPPVIKGSEDIQFCFMSRAWNRCHLKCLQLTEIHRQTDKKFIDILRQIRLGKCSESAEWALQKTMNQSVESNGVKATRLCTHRDDADSINSQQLANLQGEERCYTMCDADGTARCDVTIAAPHKLRLKIGAQVMLCKNLDISKGLVNGARGVVKAWDMDMNELPTVEFRCGVTMTIQPVTWGCHVAEARVLRKQLPLKLAWALSVHKSQGMTLDCAELSLSRVFECGQTYVALSRCRSLKAVRCIDFYASTSVKANPAVLQFYNKLGFI